MISFKSYITENRIVLRGFGGSRDTSRSDSFIKDLHNTSSDHPFDNKKRILHGVAVHLSREGNTVHIHDLQSASPDSGHGTKALKHLTNLADKHNVKLTLHAKAYSKRPEHIQSTITLQKWYKKHGFHHDDHDEDHSQGSDMTYYPK